jgi:hypothetical protein
MGAALRCSLTSACWDLLSVAAAPLSPIQHSPAQASPILPHHTNQNRSSYHFTSTLNCTCGLHPDWGLRSWYRWKVVSTHLGSHAYTVSTPIGSSCERPRVLQGSYDVSTAQRFVSSWRCLQSNFISGMNPRDDLGFLWRVTGNALRWRIQEGVVQSSFLRCCVAWTSPVNLLVCTTPGYRVHDKVQCCT